MVCLHFSHSAPITPGASAWSQCCALRYALAPFRPCPLGFFESLESVSPSPLEGGTGSSLLFGVALLPDENELPVALALDEDELDVDSSPGLDSLASLPASLVSFAAAAAVILAICRSCLPSERTNWFQSRARMRGQSSGSSFCWSARWIA